MEKFLKTLIETAVAPIIALLTDINNKLGLVTGVAVQVPAVTPVVSRIDEPALTPSVPAAAVNVTPTVPASNITRVVTKDEMGKAFLVYAQASDDNLTKAHAIIQKFGITTLQNAKESDYLPLMLALEAAIATTPAKAAESLI